MSRVSRKLTLFNAYRKAWSKLFLVFELKQGEENREEYDRLNALWHKRYRQRERFGKELEFLLRLDKELNKGDPE